MYKFLLMVVLLLIVAGAGRAEEREPYKLVLKPAAFETFTEFGSYGLGLSAKLYDFNEARKLWLDVAGVKDQEADSYGALVGLSTEAGEGLNKWTLGIVDRTGLGYLFQSDLIVLYGATDF